jgi:hypothetical protein
MTALAHGYYEIELWVYAFNSPYRIYKLHATTGSLYGSFNSPCWNNTTGLSYEDAGYLWLGNARNEYVYKCSSRDGSIYSSWRCYHDLEGGVTTQAIGDGGVKPVAVFVNYLSKFWRHNVQTGGIYSSFNAAVNLYDTAWDWRNELLWGGDSGGSYIYGYTSTGSLTASFRGPASELTGMCYYGQYLWVSDFWGMTIWRIHCPGPAPVSPASLGRVKAMFR